MPALQTKAGRDPLGLMTITQDRIMPILVPGVLALSQRARYFTYYPFLLDEFEKRSAQASNQALSDFIKLREFELAYAVQLCPNGCGRTSSGAVGTMAAQSVNSRYVEGPIERRESVESSLGGFGLYYRAPLIDLGVVVPKGTPFGVEDEMKPTPVDVLARDDRAKQLAAAYRNAIENTAYFRDWFVGEEPIPTEVLAGLAESGCLCRLIEAPDEQELIRDLLFSPAAGEQPDFVQRDLDQRRRSFALFLRELGQNPNVADADGSLHEAVWDDFSVNVDARGPLGQTLSQWAALMAKDYYQDGLSSIFAHLWRLGLGTPSVNGLSPTELDSLIAGPLFGPGQVEVAERVIDYTSDMPTNQFIDAIRERTGDLPFSVLRGAAVAEPTGATGFLLVLATVGRLPDPDEAADGWREIGAQSSERQPSILMFSHLLDAHLDDEPTVVETFNWLVRRFVIAAHEQIAYSKLPDFTFRFRWEGGRLRFYNLGQGRFELADVRRSAMSRISEDIGMWQRDDDPLLTEVGRAFVSEVFG